MQWDLKDLCGPDNLTLANSNSFVKTIINFVEKISALLSDNKIGKIHGQELFRALEKTFLKKKNTHTHKRKDISGIQVNKFSLHGNNAVQWRYME